MKKYNYHDRALKKAGFDTGVKGEKPLELSPQMQAGLLRLAEEQGSYLVDSFQLNGRRVSDAKLDESLVRRGLIQHVPDDDNCSYWARGRCRQTTKKGRRVAKLIWAFVRDESAHIREAEKQAEEKRQDRRDEVEGVASELNKAFAASGIGRVLCRRRFGELSLSFDVAQARALIKVLRGER
jgi:hypothetical protein